MGNYLTTPFENPKTLQKIIFPADDVTWDFLAQDEEGYFDCIEAYFNSGWL